MLVTLTTDFGHASPYVAAMKGVVFSIAPDARIVDLTHTIPAQNITHAARYLAACVAFFPPGTIHVAVVDPGVGSSRSALLFQAGGQFLIGPDNGIWSPTVEQIAPNPVVRRIENSKFMRATVSATFHGRDVFAPAAAHLANGTEPAEAGPVVDDWIKLRLPTAIRDGAKLLGEIAFIDDFGNAITNIPGDWLTAGDVLVHVSNAVLPVRRVRTYAAAAPDETVLLTSSDGWVELAVVKGDASRTYGLRVGDSVLVNLG